MAGPYRDILVLQHKGILSEQQWASLHYVLQIAESDDNFCRSHELVCRNSISRNARKIRKAARHYYLRPFYFLVNKN